MRSRNLFDKHRRSSLEHPRYEDGEPVLRFGLHSMATDWPPGCPIVSASERDPAYPPELFAEQDDALYSQ
jgi:hypothetical protein